MEAREYNERLEWSPSRREVGRVFCVSGDQQGKDHGFRSIESEMV